MGKSWLDATKQGIILRKNKRLIYQLASQYGIKEIIIFGSVARGDADDFSDVDMLVDINLKTNHPDDLYNLSRQIRNTTTLNCDISCKLTMNESVYNTAIREGKIL